MKLKEKSVVHRVRFGGYFNRGRGSSSGNIKSFSIVSPDIARALVCDDDSTITDAKPSCLRS